MDLQLFINGVDRTSIVDWRSFSKEDNLTYQADALNFTYHKYGSAVYVPALFDEIVLIDNDAGGERVFGGRIVDLSKSLEPNFSVKYSIKCKDWTVELDVLVVNTYTNQTVAEIINDILPAGFTDSNVFCNVLVERIAFNYQAVAECLKTLAELVNYHWYVDYNKDIHFFPKGNESAPFSITDNSSNFIAGTLELSTDISQLRNSTFVRGGEYVGLARTEQYIADGDQTTFPLSNKFSSLPTVTRNGTPLTVGVENLDSFPTFDVLWDFNQKYIRFNAPETIGNLIAITGTPLIPLITRSNDGASIALYGSRQHKIEDKNLKDPDTAKQRGNADLEAYAYGVVDGGFDTYNGGLRSGQTILINSALLEANENYLINSVRLRVQNPNQGKYTVSLVSHRSLGLNELLQKLLTDGDRITAQEANEVLSKYEVVNESILVTESIGLDIPFETSETIEVSEVVQTSSTAPEWVWGLYAPTSLADPKRSFIWDYGFTWEA